MHLNPILQEGGKIDHQKQFKIQRGIYVLSTILSKLFCVTLIYHSLFVLDKIGLLSKSNIILSCPGCCTPTLEVVTHCHFRIWTQRVTFETQEPSDI